MSSRRATALIAGAVTLLAGCLPAVTASAATKPAAKTVASQPATKSSVKPKGNVQLPGVVSSTPATYTPNIYAGPACGTGCSKFSTVYSTVVVNGEVVVAGAFGEACTPAPATYAQCPTTATTYDMLAYNPATGAIDPNFHPTFSSNAVIYSLAAGPNNTVYLGGSFTTVNGTSEEGVAQLNVDPGQSNDGTTVTGFTAYTNNIVYAVQYSGNALYIGGQNADTDGVKTTGISRVNATTGALDTSFKFTLADPNGGILQVKTMSLSPNGNSLAIAGTFQQVNKQSIPRLALISTGGALGATATLNNFSVPLLTNTCSHQHNYINGVDFSPDSSFFVIADTGFGSNGEPGICDATARFNVTQSGTSVSPVWINYTGGDSFRSLVVAGSVVYVGGHERWLNDECGNNHVCEANSVLVEGIGAIDANTGLALPWWQPMTGRGRGVQSLATYPAGTYAGSNGGLLLGTDVSNIGGATHYELGQFPLASASTVTAGGPILNGMWSAGRVGGLEETGAGIADQCVDDPGNSTTPGTAVDIATCNNSNQQNWTIGSGNTIQVNGLCLDTLAGVTLPGTAVVLNTCDGATSQEWTQSTGNTLINQAAGICLDDPNSSTTSGTKLDINTCSGALSQSWPLPSAQAPPAPPPVGPVFDGQVYSDDGVPCMTDYKGISSVQGEKIIESACEGLTSQTWTLEPNGTIQFKGHCLDTASSGTAPGTLVVLDKCTGVSSQAWTPQSNYELTNQASGLCLTAPNDTTGTQLEITTCSNEVAQQWRLPAV